MKKRALTLLLALVMCLSLCTPALAAETMPNVTAMREYLIDYGIPADFVNSTTDASVREIYAETQSYNVEVAFYETATGFDEISSSSISLCGIPSNDFTFRLLALRITNNAGTALRYIDVRASYEWLNSPADRELDGIIFDWSNTNLDYVTGSFSYTQEYKFSDTQWTSQSSESGTTYDTGNTRGLGKTFNLAIYRSSCTRGTASLHLQPVGSFSRAHIYSTYRHTESGTQSSLTISKDGPSVTFSPMSFYSERTSDATVVWPYS